MANSAGVSNLPSASSLIPDDDDDSLMDDGLPYANSQGTPTPTESSRTIKNREKALGKKKRREEKKRRQSEIAAPLVMEEQPTGSQEVEDMLRISPVPDENAIPASESLLDTFHPETVVGFVVRIEAFTVFRHSTLYRRTSLLSQMFSSVRRSPSSASSIMLEKGSRRCVGIAVRFAAPLLLLSSC